MSELSSQIILKNREPYAQNPVYHIEIDVGCPTCRRGNRGRNKNFKSLWRLYMHCRTHHIQEIEFAKPKIMNLADMIIEGYLL